MNNLGAQALAEFTSLERLKSTHNVKADCMVYTKIPW